MSDDTPFGFAKPLAIQLRNLVREQGQGGGGASGRSENRRVAIALIPSGGVAARSGTTPGTAVITLCKIDGTNGIVTTSVQETGYNIDCTAVPQDAYVTVEREYIGGAWIINPPPITDLRLDGSNLQYKRGCTWTTWTTGTSCP